MLLRTLVANQCLCLLRVPSVLPFRILPRVLFPALCSGTGFAIEAKPIQPCAVAVEVLRAGDAAGAGFHPILYSTTRTFPNLDATFFILS